MDDLTLLDGVLTKTGDLIAGVTKDQWDQPTPCTEFTVQMLMNHIIGWLQIFDAGCHGQRFEGDASAYQFGADPAEEFRSTARHLAAGWAEFGTDRPVRVMSGDMPGDLVFNMTVMEYMAHGWDLAQATNQTVPYSEDEANDTLVRAERTLPPEYRGDDMPFGPVVETAPDTPAATRLAAFLGRQP